MIKLKKSLKILDKKADINCDWCNGYGLALADCGDKKEIQKCDTCAIFPSDQQAKQWVRNNIQFRVDADIPEKYCYN